MVVNFFISKFIKKIDKNDQDEESYVEYVTSADLDNRIATSKEGLKNYIDQRVFELRETIKKNTIVDKVSTTFHSMSENMNMVKQLDDKSMKYVDIQKNLMAKQKKANGTLNELRERLYQAISEELKN